jgi:GDP-L-fucose synthase
MVPSQNKVRDFYRGKRVLVTGASGFIGTNLVSRLVQLGADVVGTIHSKPLQVTESAVNYRECDLTKMPDCLDVCRDIDFVFMCAANSSGAAVMDRRPLTHLTPNLVMNAQMLAAAYENGVQKFCFISSNTVYPLTDQPVAEEAAGFEFYEKYFIVGWMKRFSEIMCDMYSEKINRKMSTLVVRPGNLYGPFDKFDPAESKVVAALIRRAVEKQNPYVVWGDGHDVKDFLFIDDFISGLICAFARLENVGPINIASGVPVTIRDVLSIIMREVGHDDAEIIFDASKPTMIPKRLIDVSKMNRLTGWKPQVSLADGLRETIRWYRRVADRHQIEVPKP